MHSSIKSQLLSQILDRALKKTLIIALGFQTLPLNGLCSSPRDLSLPELWALETESPMTGVDISTLQYMSKHHVLFVGGLFNELTLPQYTYFVDNSSTVRREFNSTSNYYGPSSQRSIEDNIEFIYSEIINEYQQTKKPLILFAHSKGGAEVYAALLRFPELIQYHIVDGVVLVQAAIGGSYLADSESCGYIMRGAHYILGAGTQSLVPTRRQSDIRDLLSQFQSKLATLLGLKEASRAEKLHRSISKRMIYSPSYALPSDLSHGVKGVRWFCKNQDLTQVRSDGLLLVEDQISDQIGKSLEPVRADHTGLVIKLPNRLTTLHREAYTRAVLQKSVESFLEADQE